MPIVTRVRPTHGFPPITSMERVIRSRGAMPAGHPHDASLQRPSDSGPTAIQARVLDFRALNSSCVMTPWSRRALAEEIWSVAVVLPATDLKYSD